MDINHKVADTIKRDRALINKALKKYLKKFKSPTDLAKAMRHVVLSGGKRLRPLLTIESTRALGGNIKKAIPFASAIEFIHNFSLVHDDLPSMDDDDLRRGKPACHKKFGEGIAILAGDALFNLALCVLVEKRNKETLKIIRLFSDAAGMSNMIGGQALDLKYQDRLKNGSRLKKKIDRMKTAALMVASCKAGALAAGAKKRDVKKISDFAMNLGEAFQIADDIEDHKKTKHELVKMKEEAKKLISRGKKHIALFGKRADPLRYIADSILKKAELGAR